MAAFGRNAVHGPKCKVCDKVVLLKDKLTVESKVYHKTCFRCHQCKVILEPSFNYYCFVERGLLRCKPPRGSTDLLRAYELTHPKCMACEKPIYPYQKIKASGRSYHKACFKCCRGGCGINLFNYVLHEDRLYCNHHHSQLFKGKEKEKGKVGQLINMMKIVKEVTENIVLA